MCKGPFFCAVLPTFVGFIILLTAGLARVTWAPPYGSWFAVPWWWAVLHCSACVKLLSSEKRVLGALARYVTGGPLWRWCFFEFLFDQCWPFVGGLARRPFLLLSVISGSADHPLGCAQASWSCCLCPWVFGEALDIHADALKRFPHLLPVIWQFRILHLRFHSFWLDLWEVSSRSKTLTCENPVFPTPSTEEIGFLVQLMILASWPGSDRLYV